MIFIGFRCLRSWTSGHAYTRFRAVILVQERYRPLRCELALGKYLRLKYLGRKMDNFGSRLRPFVKFTKLNRSRGKRTVFWMFSCDIRICNKFFLFYIHSTNDWNFNVNLIPWNFRRYAWWILRGNWRGAKGRGIPLSVGNAPPSSYR